MKATTKGIMLCLQEGNQILAEEEIKIIVDALNILEVGHKITGHHGMQIDFIRHRHHDEVIQEKALYASNAIKLGILSKKNVKDAQSKKCTEIHFENKANIEQLNHMR